MSLFTSEKPIVKYYKAMKSLAGIIVLTALLPLLIFGKGKPSPVLRFNQDGKVKIVQFTDIHFLVDPYNRSDSALAMMKKVIAIEKPDLVVLTGDIVCSKNTEKGWMSLSKVFIDAKAPWAVTLGNHDIEKDLTGEQIMEILADMPYCLTKKGPRNITGSGNYIIPVQSSKSGKTEALFYFFDSHSSFPLPERTDFGTYEWIDFEQIHWYRKQSRKFTGKNGGQPIPSLAFFHIPLPEYKEILEQGKIIGIQEETVCSPLLNSGLFTAMLESGDVMGMFVGHDHNNNYIGCLRNICLAYGNCSGRQCYGKIGRGARVIELYEGERKFDTWILNLYECDHKKDIWIPTNDYERKFFVTYPDSFNEKQE